MSPKMQQGKHETQLELLDFLPLHRVTEDNPSSLGQRGKWRSEKCHLDMLPDITLFLSALLSPLA